MNEQPFISVVVPVYNAGLYLAGCLDSLLAQSYPHFEIILVDDGSTDDSASLIARYSARESRIRPYHQANAGVSVSRNRAIGYAKGDYLTFVDADDQVGKDYLANLLKGLSRENGRGVVIAGLEQVRSDGTRLRVEVPEKEFRHRDFGKLFAEINLHHYWYAASKLYSLSLIREKQLCFDEKLSYAEDALFLMNYLKWADYARFFPVADYYYIQHPGESLSRSNRSFTTEMAVFRKMTGHLEEIKQRYPGECNSFSLMDNEISVYLIRALPALYRPPFALKRKERLNAIGELSDKDYKLLELNYLPYRLPDKIGKKLLLCRRSKWYDLYMSLMFGLRYFFRSKSGK